MTEANYGEPWEIHTEPHWVDSCVIGPPGAMTIRTTQEMGRRIVACVNVLAGLSDEDLETLENVTEAVQSSLRRRADEYRRFRAQVDAMLKERTSA